MNKPQRYIQETNSNEAKILTIKTKQKGEIAFTSKKIDKINQLIHEKGFRLKISYLKESLNQFYCNLTRGNE